MGVSSLLRLAGSDEDLSRSGTVVSSEEVSDDFCLRKKDAGRAPLDRGREDDITTIYDGANGYVWL